MQVERLKIEVSAPNFFSMPPKKMQTESVPETGRTYFIFGGRIVAVARPAEEKR